MIETHHWQAKTLDGFCNAVEGLKKMVESSRSKYLIRFPSQSCESNVAITLHGFFEATKEKVNCPFIKPAKPGTIQHKCGPVNVDALLELAIESPLMTGIELLRQRSNRNGLFLCLHRL